MIPEELLLSHGGRLVHFTSEELLFVQDDKAENYYQIQRGQVRISTMNESGKEFIQGMFGAGDSFGEPPLFADIQYPGSATTMDDSQIIVMPKNKFLTFLSEHPKYYLILLHRLSLRLHYKATIAQAISTEQAENRILTLIDYLKQKNGKKIQDKYMVNLTRQQIADQIGLRVETVIRAIGCLKQKNHIEIKNGKIFR